MHLLRHALPAPGHQAGVGSRLLPVVRVIGCGTLDAGDDAAGLLAVRAAANELSSLPGVEVVESASPLNLVHLLEGVDVAIVVDAVRAPRGGREPGELVRAEAGPDGLPVELSSSLSSHGLGLAEAIGLAAAVAGAPRVVVLGVEVADVVAGRRLSQPVAAALPWLSSRLVAEARSHAPA